MPAKKKKSLASQKKIAQYEHPEAKRINIPPVGLVTPDTDRDGEKKTYSYDPHLDPQLQWAGKTERTSFEIPTVSLHVHERIDPKRILESVRNPHSNGQRSLFESNERPLREAVEFYKHKENWSNRLIAGDSLLVMNSLLEKEGMGGKVQMIYFDPPSGMQMLKVQMNADLLTEDLLKKRRLPFGFGGDFGKAFKASKSLTTTGTKLPSVLSDTLKFIITGRECTPH